jgi:peptidoglycan hydrolase-like protein with peptidoglycan-binding domain
MDAAVLFFGLLWALFRGKSAPAAQPSELPPVLPGQTVSTTPPWPSVRPSGLPPFPGAGWEYDEPPPRAVQARAAELRAKLWSRGKGAHQIEQTAGRWIVYQAQITRGGKQGVVAYRERRASAPRAPAGTTAQRPTSPAAPSSMPGVIPVATDLAAPNVYLMRPGTTYQVRAEAELPPGLDLEAVRRGLAAGGATDVQIDPMGIAGGHVFRYRAHPKFNSPMVIGEWMELPGGGRLRLIEVRPISSVSPMSMPTLRRGSKGDAVVMLQGKLGVPADGKFGPGTHAAVVAYQRSHGLTPDGVVGPQTWITLLGRAA